MPKWTKEQQQAIDARNHTILVSAAAGSGKTAVLIERIVTLVREGFHIDRMLIVTFTRAAAGEMRQRLNTRLTKEAAADPETYGRALDELEGADISTIHSFCQRVLKSNFQTVGIDPLARICEENMRQQHFEDAYRATVNELLDHTEEQKDDPVRILLSSFSQREMMDMASELYGFLMAMPDPFGWLRMQTEQMQTDAFVDHPWFALLIEKARLELKGAMEFLTQQERMFEETDALDALHATWQKDIDLVDGLLESAADPHALMQSLQKTRFATAARTSNLTEGEEAWKERYNQVRKAVKEIVEATKKQLMIDEAQNQHDIAQVERMLQGLCVLMEHLHNNFQAAKNQQCVIDFNDLEQLTLSVLQQQDQRELLQADYDHIFVDECQDVSAVQDAIVQLIHGKNSCLFMVGDVKQSIYRFRLADPTLFLYRMRTLSDAEDAKERRIFLQKNFRSRTNVLDASNRVFRSAMQREVTELDYLPEDELIPGRETVDDPPVEIRMVAKSEKDGAAACLESETAVVTARIRQLLQTPMGEGERNFQYRDMVILLSKTSGVGARLAELLEEQGIPVFFDGKDDYYGLPEIRTVCELLRVIDNPMNDIALLTVLKMIPFSMDEQELAAIRACKFGRDVPFYEAFAAACEQENELGLRCRKVQDMLGEWRFRREAMPLSDLVWYVIRETGFYAACGAYPEGELRQANLRLLCQKAAEYEQSSDGVLSGFLRVIDQQMRAQDSTGAKVLGENENLVRIMTMHKSKGLEFPVVFLMRLTGSLMGKNSGALKRHARLGIVLPYVNRPLNIKRELAGSEAFKHQRKLDELAERCRLLYVAMTRARERLILTGCVESTDKLTWRLQRGPYRVWAADCMLDWVMQAVTDELPQNALAQGQTMSGPWMVRVEEDCPLESRRQVISAAETVAWAENMASMAPDTSFAWWSEIGQARDIRPAKTSVSSIARKEVLGDPLPMPDTEESEEDKRAGEDIISPLRLSELPSKPAFMEEKQVTGAERGTLMHHFLALVAIDRVRGLSGFELTEAVYAQMGELVQNGCFEEASSSLLDVAKVTGYLASPLGQRMLASENVRREWAFNLRIDRRHGTLLQGVIDCAFEEDGRWILVDYKTDRIDSDEAFVQRHALQLSWYAEALERITGKPVAELWLYSLGKSRPYPVERLQVNMAE